MRPYKSSYIPIWYIDIPYTLNGTPVNRPYHVLRQDTVGCQVEQGLAVKGIGFELYLEGRGDVVTGLVMGMSRGAVWVFGAINLLTKFSRPSKWGVGFAA